MYETMRKIENRQWMMEWRSFRRRCEVVHQIRRMRDHLGYGYLYDD